MSARAAVLAALVLTASAVAPAAHPASAQDCSIGREGWDGNRRFRDCNAERGLEAWGPWFLHRAAPDWQPDHRTTPPPGRREPERPGRQRLVASTLRSASQQPNGGVPPFGGGHGAERRGPRWLPSPALAHRAERERPRHQGAPGCRRAHRQPDRHLTPVPGSSDAFGTTDPTTMCGL